ncbi:MAG: DUF4175 family protein [Myxococcota bacterium]
MAQRSQAALERLFGEARSRLGRAAWIEILLVGLLGLVSAVLLATLAARVGAQRTALAWIELSAIALGLGFAVVRGRRRLVHRSFLDLAGLLDAAVGPAPDGGPSLRSAIELLRDRGRKGESDELREEALRLAGARAERIDAPGVIGGLVRPLRQRLLMALGGAVALTTLAAVLLPKERDQALLALSGLGSADNPLVPLSPEPRFDDIRLSYRYPAYTQRPQTMTESATGEIRALPGTEVTIETNARQRLVEATLIVSYGEGEESKVAADVDGRHLRATLLISRAGRYRFSVKSEEGVRLDERRGRSIELELDLPPEVALMRPRESPLEVNEKDRVELEFSARDDFALQDAFVAWRVLGTTREGRLPLNAATRGQRHAHETAGFDLGALALRPGDRVAYSVEVSDNDTVNPKVGASETKELRIYSKESHHREVLAQASQALDELVHILGDDLEHAFIALDDSDAYRALITTTAGVVERAKNANKLLRDTVVALEKDPLGQRAIGQAFESARRDLARGARNKGSALDMARTAFERSKKADERRAKEVAKRQDEAVADLERNVVYLADLLNDQRLIDAEALTKRLREEQQNLRQALTAYRNAPDEEKRRVLLQAIHDIKERIGEITSELSQLRGSIPADFVNPDAIETQDTLEQMDQVQRMIEEGDLAGAMSSLERMLTQTEQMLSEMRGGREELGSREYSEITEKAQQLWQNLEKVEAEQSAIGRRTEQFSQQMLEKMKERLGNSDAFVEKQLRRLESAQHELEKAELGARIGDGDAYEQSYRRVDDAKRGLKAKDFGAAKEAIANALGQMTQLELDTERRAEQARKFGDYFGNGGESEHALGRIRTAMPLVAEVMADLEKLMPRPDELLSKKDLSDLEKLADRQQGLRQRTEGLKRELDKLAEQLPIVGEGTKELLDEAGQAMGESGQGLGSGDAPGALNGHQKAMDALGKLKNTLQKMSEGGRGGTGVPLPFGPPRMPGEGGGREGDQSNQANPMERVEIPKPEQYKAPAEFREDILKAAKQGTPEAYKEAVRQYYEEIVK